MRVNMEASDPAFGNPRHQADHVGELTSWAREQLGLNGSRPWKLISARTKLRKVLFEVEETGPSGPERLIGKMSPSERAQGAYGVLTQLWESGMRPPAPYTVVRPVAWLPERHLLIQEKAPGIPMLAVVRQEVEGYSEYVDKTAAWLNHLQRSGLNGPTDHPSGERAERWRSELRDCLPEVRSRIDKLADKIQAGFATAPSWEYVPSHGDFHPMNIFVAPNGRVTAIDFDTFALREPMFDVAYFLTQTAIMGYFERGSFEQTRELRDYFVNAYRGIAAAPLDLGRMGLYAGATFLQSLHYELCILKTGNASLAEPWLAASENCLTGKSADFV